MPEIVAIKIKSIKPAGKADVYNMQVNKHHNFCANNGIVLHNCDAWGYSLVAYHANKSKGLKVEQSEIAKEKMRLARQYKRGRRYA